MIYVANSDSHTVTVIDGYDNIKIKDIPVGVDPGSIAVDEFTNIIYVANTVTN